MVCGLGVYSIKQNSVFEKPFWDHLILSLPVGVTNCAKAEYIAFQSSLRDSGFLSLPALGGAGPSAGY